MSYDLNGKRGEKKPGENENELRVWRGKDIIPQAKYFAT
jgi:hypothetical protein